MHVLNRPTGWDSAKNSLLPKRHLENREKEENTTRRDHNEPLEHRETTKKFSARRDEKFKRLLRSSFFESRAKTAILSGFTLCFSEPLGSVRDES